MRIDFHGTKDNPTTIGIVGNPDKNQYLYTSKDIFESINYIQNNRGWEKDSSVGPLIMSITPEKNPEYFI